jgi:pyruvate kinase
VKVGTEDQPLRFNYNIYDQLDLNDEIFIGDGKLHTTVVENNERHVKLLINNDGLLEDRKGVNIPRKEFKIPALSNRDKQIIRFAEEQNVEFLSLSFTRNMEDLVDLRKRVKDPKTGIIAKIENFQGVENFEDILLEADGVMIARGDLGIEIEAEKVPTVQKRMIQQCNQKGKLVITATEMLDSMIKNPFPTRAEVSDVANAILDGTDAVMLSGETAIGRYPVESVFMIAKIAEQTERNVVSRVIEEKHRNISTTISRSVYQLAGSMPLDKVVTITRTGYTARMISRFKIKQPIIAVTSNQKVKNKLTLMYGVYPVKFDYEKEEDRILAAARELHSKGVLQEEDIVLFTAGFRTFQRHSSNVIEIHTVRELLEFGKEKFN